MIRSVLLGRDHNVLTPGFTGVLEQDFHEILNPNIKPYQILLNPNFKISR